ncbi:uncharacterized protein [Halyomorpha halys]|uniref:uncharacterized protein n=1 Tax=Halyomorpha halys TaxID=286706 RepID=UPI0034D20E67
MSAFLTSLERFIARRGALSAILPDHGTNFVGASSFLKEVYKFQKESQTIVTNNLAQKGIDWKFILPRAPYFGGLWEAGVKSMKRLLASSVRSQLFAFEALATALIEIEALLNSCPLYSLTEDSSIFDFLTPVHIPIGGPSYHCFCVQNHLSHLHHLSRSGK